jgi:hypothetical protein
VVDEIYHGLTYGTDAASVLEVDDEAFVLNSFSKYFGMTGWRLGWLVAPPAAVGDLEKLAQNLYISAPSMAQHAALACSPADPEHSRRAPCRVRSPSRLLLPALRELGFRIAVEPEGRSICMPISVRSAAMPSRSAAISLKPNMWRLRRAGFRSLSGRASCALCLHPNLIGFRKRWNASPVACGAGKADAFSSSLEEARLIRRYKRFLTDIETVTGELLTIHCPNTGSMLNCMVEGGQVWFSRSNDPKRKLPGTWKCRNPQGRLACVTPRAPTR